MKRSITTLFVAALTIALAIPAFAQNPGTYMSANRGGNVQNGHVSVSRMFPNSGNPKVFHSQSWNGSTLGLQWEMRCGVETTSTPPDLSQFNVGTGTGLITYHQTFQGGTFTLYPDPAVGWVNVVPANGTLGTTSVVTQVQLIGGQVISSSFTGSTTGQFETGCTMDFAMGNGFGQGETSDPPAMTKPASYPAFLAADCTPKDALHQFGTWGDVNDIVVHINSNCATPTHQSTWGQVKSIYR